MLATNTSSIPVTELAAGVPRPERVVGHALLQPGAGDAARRGDRRRAVAASAALALARAPGEAMGKRVIDAADGPGFLVNRCGRPFGLEALRLRAGAARRRVEQIDRICRLGGGFRMGPFELLDLVGIDVGFEVSKSFYELSLRRAALAARRRSPRGWSPRAASAARPGRGWYDYADDGPHRPDGPARAGGRRRRRPRSS